MVISITVLYKKKYIYISEIQKLYESRRQQRDVREIVVWKFRYWIVKLYKRSASEIGDADLLWNI